jgi:hypothetical protein
MTIEMSRKCKWEHGVLYACNKLLDSNVIITKKGVCIDNLSFRNKEFFNVCPFCTADILNDGE